MNRKIVFPVILTLFILLVPAASASQRFQTAVIHQLSTAQDSIPESNGDWWTVVQRDIGQDEYSITWQEQTALTDLAAAYQAPNRAQNLRTFYTPTGPRLISRIYEGERPPWEWGLALSSYGSEAVIQPTVTATVHVSGNQLEYQREGLIERYLNNEQGVEQSFILAARPDELHDSVILNLNWTGELYAEIGDDGLAVDWTTAGGVHVLNQKDLAAYDVNGRRLPVQIRLDKSQAVIQLAVDTAGAVYPITIRSLLTTPDWSAEGNQTFANFGWSVGTAGDVNGDGYSDVIVGAFLYDNGQNEEGRAYVYHGSPTGLSLAAAWTAESNQADAVFGYSVGTAGDVNGDGYSDVVVGSYVYDNDQVNDGRVFVYHGSPTGLSTTANWAVEGDQANGSLGTSVGTAGDVNGDGYSDVIVGAGWYDNGQIDEGRAYVYHGSSIGLSTTADWTAESNQADAAFGWAVDTAGDVNGDGYSDVIVSALYYDDVEEDEGQAYVYHGGPTGLSPTAAWTAKGEHMGANLGTSVGTAGDINGDGYSDVVVGSSGYWDSHAYEGRAYVYHGTAAGLSAVANWTFETNQSWTILGESVGTAGDVNGDGYSDVILGAPYYYQGGGQSMEGGTIYVFYGRADGLADTADWRIDGEQIDAEFGWSAGTAGDVNGDGYSDIIVGAHLYHGGQMDEGRAYVYHGGAAGLADDAAWTAESDQEDARFGCSVGTAGDVNGDGYSDVIVGACRYDNGQSDEGRAYLYYGGTDGLSTTAAWTAEINQDSAQFGWAVGTAGDVNGDGYSDVIVGAIYYTNGELYEGGAFAYYGSASGLSTVADWVVESNQLDSVWGVRFGSSVATAGDVNGDGYSDVVVGAPFYDSDLDAQEGRAYIYHGSASGLSKVENSAVEGNSSFALLGLSAGTAGDVNGDGYSDVIVGAPSGDNIPLHEGQVRVYYGSEEGISSEADWMIESEQKGSYLGYSVGTAGDVNGDGYSDVIMGELSYDGVEMNKGRVLIYHGSPNGLEDVPAWMSQSGQFDNWYGWSVGTTGDVNGDGYSDVIIGWPYYENVEDNEGAIYVHYGSPTGISSANFWTFESNNQFAGLGNWVGAAGDVNGDGYNDIIAGARWYSNGQEFEGRVFVFYGNGIDGLHILPRQLRSDGSARIDLLGLSDSPTAFQLSLLGRMPLGREDVKLQWQVAPLGVPITSSNIISGVSPVWIDTLAGGVEINEMVTNLEPDTLYHWRIRLLYHPGNAMGQMSSRWIHVPWNGENESELRTRRFSFWGYLPTVFCLC